jgi:hypothetical protein
VNHTFKPYAKTADGVFEFREVTGVPIGDPKITIQSRKTAAGKYQTKIKGSWPIVQTQTINGISTPVVVRTAYIDTTLTFEGTSTIQERKDVVSETMNLFSSTVNTAANLWLVDTVLANGEGMF